MRRVHATAIAWVVVAVFLGHGAVMAASPHRVETERALARVEAFVGRDVEAGDAHDASPASGSSLDTICPAPDTARTAAPDPGLDGPPVPGVVLVSPLRLAVPVGMHCCGDIPPGHPPAVRRALLQVYLN